ncbi:MAG: bifunctional methylenetetrahydrofolate dehydrogenase/methenyltetrahydrofolate cyclohydrolase FolD [Alphaproteobacteria bacterium]|nr:bifunctional methylenetetrahydrofolate dehydrogenase/methenyltetrahydrofolate cyclohydrolase FolD [Alphaproteobacteria bacterium]
MSAAVIDGAAIAKQIRTQTAQAVAALAERHGATPTLAVVLVGDDPASQIYVRAKVKDTEAAGMRSIEKRLPADAAQDDVERVVATLSADPDVDGILLQLPLPAHLNEAQALARLDPAKDVDGLTEASAGKLVLGKQGLRPCTPVGCVLLAKSVQSDLTGARCTVVGRSILVGKPSALLFLEQNCTVTIAHSRTRDVSGACRDADVLIVAAGRQEMVRGDWIKPGAIVIDVGMHRISLGEGKTKLLGDVAYDEAAAVARAITPVPGGVGPMTRACLLRNTVLAACARRGWAAPDL